MTLEGGEKLDSRQPVEDDPESEVALGTMAGSLEWWMTLTSVVRPILDGAGPDAFAVITGPRTVTDLKPDGTLRRTRLRSFLDGGVGTVEIVRTSWSDPLDDRYERAGELRLQSELMGTIGVQLRPAGARWRLLAGSAAYLNIATPTIAPTAIVDTELDTITPLFSSYEETRLLANGVTLLLPHTPATERLLAGAAWVGGGGKTLTIGAQDASHTRRHLDRRVPLVRDFGVGHGPAVVVSAKFGVTGLFRDGEWHDPAALEAARAFLQSRFDLRIGLWDLVDHPSLRESLLKRGAVAPAPLATAAVPRGVKRRSALRESARESERKRRDEVLDEIRKHFAVLEPLGWQDAEPWFLPLTSPVPRHGKMIVLGSLEFSIERARTDTVVRVLIYNQFDPSEYTASKRSLLEQIAAPGECHVGTPYPLLWRVAGGWGDDVNWTERVAELAEKTPLWLEALDQLPALLLDAYTRYFDKNGDLRSDSARWARREH